MIVPTFIVPSVGVGDMHVQYLNGIEQTSKFFLVSVLFIVLFQGHDHIFSEKTKE